MILKIAWRNIWRNPWRSAIVFMAIAFGLWGVNLITGLANGLIKGQIDSAINNELAHLTVQHKSYALQEELKYNYDEQVVEGKLLQEGLIVTHRQLVTAMLSSAGYTQGLTLVGVNPAIEKQVVSIYSCIEKGSYFNDSLTTPVLISAKTAEELKVRIKSKLVANFPDINNEVVYGLFRVVGIYKTDNQNYDQQHAFVLRKDLSPLLKLKSNLVHESLIKRKTSNNEEFDLDQLKDKVQGQLSPLSIRTWSEIRPELLLGKSSTEIFLYVILTIVMISLVFVIVNSMLMVILERIHELGTLRALGMNKNKVMLMIFYETVFLALIGGVLGTLLSYGVVSYFSIHGMQFDSVAEGLEAYGYPGIFYPYLSFQSYLTSLVMVFFTALVSAIPPVRRALKLNPSSAIRSV